jgi:hypothetical protein
MFALITRPGAMLTPREHVFGNYAMGMLTKREHGTQKFSMEPRSQHNAFLVRIYDVSKPSTATDEFGVQAVVDEVEDRVDRLAGQFGASLKDWLEDTLNHPIPDSWPSRTGALRPTFRVSADLPSNFCMHAPFFNCTELRTCSCRQLAMSLRV